jgi:hypothetical protein
MSIIRYSPKEIRIVAAAILWDKFASPSDKGHQRLRIITQLLAAFPEQARTLGIDQATPPTYAKAHQFVAACLDEVNAAAHFDRYGDGGDLADEFLNPDRYRAGDDLSLLQAKQALGDWCLGAGFMYNSDTYDFRATAIFAALHAAAWRILQAEEAARRGDGVKKTGHDYLAILSR